MDGKSILIVEDELVVALEIQKSLYRQGYNSKIVTTAEDAINFTQKNTPDLILMDIYISNNKNDGIYAAREIKKFSDIPCIFISAQSDESTLSRAKETHPAGFLIKPIDEKELYTTIVIVLNKYEAERKLRESEEKYRTLFERMVQGAFYMDSEGRILSINPAALKILGLQEKKVIGEFIMDPKWKKINLDGNICPPENYPVIIALKEGKEISNQTLGFFNEKNKIIKWINISAVPLFRGGEKKPFQVFTTFEDVTELKNSKKQIESDLKEKEALIKEVHHRVKNNLQIISSLLGLQLDYIKDPEALEMFKESRNRIRSMAIIHELLYQSDNLAAVNSADYITRLVHYLFNSYNINSELIRTQLDIDNIHLSVDHAISCGQIINELVSNSLKYAFPDNRKGEIKVILKNTSNVCLLKVLDNGIGFPAHIDFKNTESLGLTLVNTFVMQLKGKIEMKRTFGTEFIVSFKKDYLKIK